MNKIQVRVWVEVIIARSFILEICFLNGSMNNLLMPINLVLIMHDRFFEYLCNFYLAAHFVSLCLYFYFQFVGSNGIVCRPEIFVSVTFGVIAKYQLEPCKPCQLYLLSSPSHLCFVSEILQNFQNKLLILYSLGLEGFFTAC